MTKQLLQDCKTGNRKAQYQLFRACFALLMSVCLRYKKNKEDATAVLNQGFLKILTNLDKYRPEVPFEACRDGCAGEKSTREDEEN